MRFVSALVVLACWAAGAEAATGVDVSSPVYLNAWQCLKKAGHTYAIIRVWQSNGVPDPNGPHTVYNAWDGGMEQVDVYLFPCFSCGDAAGQVKKTIDYLAGYNITNRSKYGPPHTFGTLWFDIEGPQYWPGSASSHVDFMSQLVNEAKALGVTHGIYSSPSQWNPIMGGSSAFSSNPLWWPNYDGKPNLRDDWSDFGGWRSAVMKQYEGNVDQCGVGVDLNFS